MLLVASAHQFPTHAYSFPAVRLGISLLVETRSKVVRGLLLIFAFAVLTGCENFMRKPAVQEPVEPAPAAVQPKLPSAAAIAKPSNADIRYVQKTLNTLGYVAGPVDGIWGPQTSRAIKNFERKYGLESAGGSLSKLNIYILQKVSAKQRPTNTRSVNKSKPTGIAAKLDPNIPLSDAPQLIFLDQPYAMLAKPNPFSEELDKLSIGTGVYIISLQEGWYEVESEDKQRGYVEAD